MCYINYENILECMEKKENRRNRETLGISEIN